jgi:hypothetical protein
MAHLHFDFFEVGDLPSGRGFAQVPVAAVVTLA